MRDLDYNLFYDSKKKFDEVEVFSFSRKETSIYLKDNNIIDASENESSQLALRVINNGRLGYVTSSGHFRNCELIELAKDTAALGEKVRFSLDNNFENYQFVNIYNDDLCAMDINRMNKLANETMSNLKNLSDFLQYNCRLTTVVDNINLISNNTKKCSYVKTHFSINFEGKLISDNNSRILNYKNATCRGIEISKNFLDSIIKQKECELPYNKEKLPELCEVVLTPNCVYSIFKNIFAMSFNGKRASAGIVKREKYSNLINIFDDGISDWMINSQPFDDEGVACKKNILVHEGENQNFIFDKRTADIFNFRSSGNGKRGWGSPPAPVPNNFIITGNVVNNISDIIQSIKQGILVDYVINDGKSQPTNGIYSGYILRGYYIKDGVLTSVINGKHLKVEASDSLNKIVAIGDDSTVINGEMCTPSIYLSGVKIS